MDLEVVVEGASQVAEVLEDRDVENVEKRDTSLENALTNLLEVTSLFKHYSITCFTDN